MNFKSHLMMGKVLYEYLQKRLNVPLNRFEFVYGNVRPDIFPGFLATPHTKEYFYEYVKSELEEIEKINLIQSVDDDKTYSLRLGIICHYITDFFCYPHNTDFHKGTLAHCVYEKKLYWYMKQRVNLFENIENLEKAGVLVGAQKMQDEIERSHKEYMDTRTYCGYDLLYAFDSCMVITSSLLSQIEENTAHALEEIYAANCTIY